MPKRGFRQGECCEFLMSYVLVKFWRTKPEFQRLTPCLPRKVPLLQICGACGVIRCLMNEISRPVGSWCWIVECFDLADALRQIFAPCICLYGLLAILRIGATGRIDATKVSWRKKSREPPDGKTTAASLQPRAASDLTKGLCGDTKGRTLWMVLWLQRPLLDQWGQGKGLIPSSWCWGLGHGMSRYVRKFGGIY